MARIRTIKPEFTAHEALSELPAETHLLAAGLLCYADDMGYFKANPKLVKAAIFPLRECSQEMETMLTQLQGIGYIELGSHAGKRYGRVVNFTKHQRVAHPNPSQISTLEIEWESLGEIQEDSRNFQERSRNHPRTSGRKGKGNKEREQGTGKGCGEGVSALPAETLSAGADVSSPVETVQGLDFEFEPSTNGFALTPGRTPGRGRRKGKTDAELNHQLDLLWEAWLSWREAMGIPRLVTDTLDAGRRQKAMARLKEALKETAGDLEKATDMMTWACWGTLDNPWNNGSDPDNGKKKKYLDWEKHVFGSETTFKKRIEFYKREIEPKQAGYRRETDWSVLSGK